MFVCFTVSELRFYGCCHPCFNTLGQNQQCHNYNGLPDNDLKALTDIGLDQDGRLYLVDTHNDNKQRLYIQQDVFERYGYAESVMCGVNRNKSKKEG